MKLMLIPESLEMAREAVAAGVDRIFVDLERAGKRERQGGGTWISTHDIDDIAAYRDAAGDSELLVRLDPMPSVEDGVVERVLAAGADVIMLPMISAVSEVEMLSAEIGVRAGLAPLIETLESAGELDRICRINGVSEIFVGLNDLHRQRGDQFMFEPLADGTVDSLCRITRANGLPFGFGGMARIGRGDLPAEWILGEHLRMGSSSVILSRKFKASAGPEFSWPDEIARIREAEAALTRRSEAEMDRDRRRTTTRIEEIAESLGVPG